MSRATTDVVTLPASVVTSSTLPSIGLCPLHGRPPVSVRKTTFKSKTPDWVWLFILVGVLVAFVISEMVVKRVTGPVPECPTCISERKRRTQLLVAAWGAALVGIVVIVAFADTNDALAAVGGLLFLVGVLWGLVQVIVNGRRGLKGVVSKDGASVDVTCVPAFGAACRERIAAATPQAPPGYYGAPPTPPA